MYVQFRPDVLLVEGAQAATAIRQLDGAADLRLQVVQGRRSVQGCDYLLQLVPELRQLLSSQRGAVARMEHTCLSGLELDLACQPVRVGTAPLVGPFVSADPQHESADPCPATVASVATSTKVAAERRWRFIFPDPEAAYPSKEHVLGNRRGGRCARRPHPPLKAIRCSFRERQPGYERQPEGTGRVRTEKEIPEDWGN
jgi:hypothetical protein